MALRNPSKRHSWNPGTAGRTPAALRASAQMLHSPDTVRLTGILGGLGYSIVGTVITP